MALARPVALALGTLLLLANAPVSALEGAKATPTPPLSPHETTVVGTGLALGEARRAKALPHSPSSPVPHDTERLVLAHYMPFYAVSKDNADPTQDFYTRNYLTNTGESGRHLAYGGLLRDRPLPRAPISGDYQSADLRTEVRRAVAAGLDGFTVDLIGLEGGNNDAQARRLLDAAASVAPDFSITLMPDLWIGVAQPTAIQLADHLADLAKYTSVHRTADGRLVVAPFGADRIPASYWAAVIARLAVRGERVFFVPCLLNYWANADQFAPISQGLSAWGYHNVGADVANDVAGMADDTHDRGLLWMHPAAFGDSRPYAGTYNETGGTDLLRHTFDSAIRSDAEWVQVVTWNDYSENTFISPSPSIGWAVLDLVSFYAKWFQDDRRPKIRRDIVYLSHRRQAITSGASLQPIPLRVREGTAPRDEIEVLVFLTARSRVIVRSGASSVSRKVGAGIHILKVPLRVGTPSVSVKRSGKTVAAVRAMFPIVSDPEVQTTNYYVVSSGRTGS